VRKLKPARSRQDEMTILDRRLELFLISRISGSAGRKSEVFARPDFREMDVETQMKLFSSLRNTPSTGRRAEAAGDRQGIERRLDKLRTSWSK
jgi:hypothetical protein